MSFLFDKDDSVGGRIVATSSANRNSDTSFSSLSDSCNSFGDALLLVDGPRDDANDDHDDEDNNSNTMSPLSPSDPSFRLATLDYPLKKLFSKEKKHRKSMTDEDVLTTATTKSTSDDALLSTAKPLRADVTPYWKSNGGYFAIRSLPTVEPFEKHKKIVAQDFGLPLPLETYFHGKTANPPSEMQLLVEKERLRRKKERAKNRPKHHFRSHSAPMAYGNHQRKKKGNRIGFIDGDKNGNNDALPYTRVRFS